MPLFTRSSSQKWEEVFTVIWASTRQRYTAIYRYVHDFIRDVFSSMNFEKKRITVRKQMVKADRIFPEGMAITCRARFEWGASRPRDDEDVTTLGCAHFYCTNISVYCCWSTVHCHRHPNISFVFPCVGRTQLTLFLEFTLDWSPCIRIYEQLPVGNISKLYNSM